MFSLSDQLADRCTCGSAHISHENFFQRRRADVDRSDVIAVLNRFHKLRVEIAHKHSPLTLFAFLLNDGGAEIGRPRRAVAHGHRNLANILLQLVESLKDNQLSMSQHGDNVGDYAASEPFLDLPIDALRSDLEEDVGRVALLSGNGGGTIFDVLGTRTGSRLGRALAGGVDWDGDGVPDLISGNPGDSPDLRRGAGSVTVFSGVDGAPIGRG